MADEMEEFIEQELDELKNFIYNDCIDESNHEEKMRFAVDKSVSNILMTLRKEHEKEIAEIKEKYAEKMIQNQQALLEQFSAILDKAVTTLVHK